MQHVGFFVCPNHRILDLAGPLGAFEEANILIERGGYRLTVVSESGGTVVGSSGVPIDTQSSLDTAFDTVLFIGGNIGPFQNPNTIAVAKDLVTRTGFVAEILERDSL
ncbi:DJ-1/PfpI family protein, partial [Acetobacter fabarum]